MASSIFALQVKDLKKRFGKVEVIKGISFDIKQGKCVGLLGPNGAGKTTTLEMLEQISKPTSGEILYMGEPIQKDFHEKCGIQFQYTALQEFLTALDNLKFFAAIYKQKVDLDYLIDVCQLGDYINRDAKKLSGGQRQRLLLAIALINDPEILFLDEPTTGLDPQSRQNFWALINNIKLKNKTIVLSTHYMDEAYNICDHLLIIDHGALIAEGSPRKLLHEHFKESIIVLPVDELSQLPATMEATLSDDGQYCKIITVDLKQSILQLLESKTPMDNLRVSSATLDDLFIKLTGRALRT